MIERIDDKDLIIGVDFDNTVVSYEDILYTLAIEGGLIPQDASRSKKSIRDCIRKLPDGEIEWQKLQAVVYGPRIEEAKVIDGVQNFFSLCKKHQIRAYIVSHKTEYARYDETETNLRQAALAWMKRNNFFAADGLGLLPEKVYFESTRREKVERIKLLCCTHFIDDLEETFLENTFPENVEKILFAPYMDHSSLGDVRVLASWKDISNYFFNTPH